MEFAEEAWDAGEKRDLGGIARGPGAEPGSDARQLPEGNTEMGQELAGIIVADQFVFGGSNGPKIEFGSDLIENPDEPGKGISKSAIEVKNDDLVSRRGVQNHSAQ